MHWVHVVDIPVHFKQPIAHTEHESVFELSIYWPTGHTLLHVFDKALK